MPGLFPCSWKNPLVHRQRQPRLLNAAAYNPRPPIQQPKPARIYLPAVIPAEELCPLVTDDREIEQAVRRIQREADCDYKPSQVMGMAREFNRNLDNMIEKLNTMPQEQEVVKHPDLMELMVTVSRYSHILEGFVQNKIISYKL